MNARDEWVFYRDTVKQAWHWKHTDRRDNVEVSPPFDTVAECRADASRHGYVEVFPEPAKKKTIDTRGGEP